MIDGVYVYCVDLPDGVNEMVTPCEDGYTVYIDAKQTREGMRESYDHAMKHIRERDHDKNITADEIEAEARK